MQLLAVAGVLVALTAGYLFLLRHFNVAELPDERRFGATGQGAPAGEVYLEPISIDALNNAMQVRAYLSPGIAVNKDAHDAPGRDLTLLVTHDKTVEEVKLAGADHIASSTFEVDLNEGSIANYPWDSYVTRLNVQVMDGKSSIRLPARITVWEGVFGYNLHTTSQPGPDPDVVQLTTSIVRSGGFSLLALCVYGAMLVLGFCAIVVGVLTVTNAREPETGLLASLAGFSLTLPFLRNALPGSPPLGVLADMWIFLWVELVIVLALAVVVIKWAKADPTL